MSVPTNKNISAKIVFHISSVFRDLSVIVNKYILSSSPKLVDAAPAGNLHS